MNYLIFLFLFSLSIMGCHAADLNGASETLVITQHYYFEDTDVVTGTIIFQNGFTLPKNGIVAFHLSPGSMVHGVINMNNGGLILYEPLWLEDVTFRGNGDIHNAWFIVKGSMNLQECELSITGERLKIGGVVFAIIDIDEDSIFDIAGVTQQATFSYIYFSGDFVITSESTPYNLLLSNVMCNFLELEGVDVLCPHVYLYGDNYIYSDNLDTVNVAQELHFINGARLSCAVPYKDWFQKGYEWFTWANNLWECIEAA